MKKLISLLLALCLSVSLAACQGKSDIDENAYDIEGVVEITYSEIDPVCDEEGLRTECEKVLTSMQESDDILLSFVVDSSILIEENELGKYDHLVMVNPAWIEKYDDMSNLQEVSIEDISAEMREFLEVQMPVWTVDGSVLPDGIRLYEYKGEGLLAFPVNTGTANSAIKAKSPLIVMVDDPMVSMSAKAFTIPMTSSTNLIFTDKEKLEEELEKSSISSYIEDVKGISLEME